MPDWAPPVRARLASIRLSPTREAEIVDELSQHLEDRYRELIAGGTAPDEATRLALADFPGDGVSDAGARDRRHDGDLQRRVRGAVETPAFPRGGQAGELASPRAAWRRNGSRLRHLSDLPREPTGVRGDR